MLTKYFIISFHPNHFYSIMAMEQAATQQQQDRTAHSDCEKHRTAQHTLLTTAAERVAAELADVNDVGSPGLRAVELGR